MIQNVKNTAVAVLLVVAAGRLQADQTNLVQDLHIRLSGIAQGQTETGGNQVKTGLDFVRVNNNEVIKKLGKSTGNTFSDHAKLVVITPLPDGKSAIAIRDGSASFDVTSFFVYEQKSGFVSTSQMNLRTHRGTSIDYSIQRLALTDSSAYPALSLHFDVQGIGVETTSSQGNIETRTELDAGVSGSGDQNGKLIILEGTIQVQGHSLEVISTQPPPNA